MADACRDQQGRLAMAAIGRLDPAELTALDAHLEGCAACRAEAAELGAVASALALADPERVVGGAAAGERPRPGPAVRHTVLARMAAESARRRRRRTVVVVAAAAAVLVVAGVVAVGLTRSDGRAGEEVALTGPEGGSATGTAVLTPRGWGTEIDLEVEGLDPGTVYNVWLRRSDDTRFAAGSFVAVRSTGSMTVDTACALQADQAAGIGISTGEETVLYGHLEGAPDAPD